MDTLKSFKTNLAYYFSEVLSRPFARPRWVYLSLSHKCTYACQMCGVVRILSGYELAKEEVKKALDEICAWAWDSRLVFTGGEPFLRKDIFELFDYARQKGLKAEAVSNGALIDKNLAAKIISCGLENIAISLDGARESTHDAIRQKGAFKQAIGALINLAEAKRRLGYGPQISVWTTIMRQNLKELAEIIPLAKESGAECLVYHPVVVVQEDMQNTSPDADFWVRGDDLELLKEQIDKISDYRAKYGLVAFLHDPYLWVKYFQGTLTKKDWRCNPFVFINIGPDGEVRSCGATYGNIKEGGLGQCLNTPEATRARRIMSACTKPCLQTCWADPESDSLRALVRTFIGGVKNNGNKTDALKEALRILRQYKSELINQRCSG